MAYPDELLDLASELAHDTQARQASLRRSASTAYYALFHLLISDAIANWSRASSRPLLGRMFDHDRMRRVSVKVFTQPSQILSSPATTVVLDDLQFVAKTFVELQKKRQEADYDFSAYWTPTDVLTLLSHCRQAFQRWQHVRNEDIAQECLVKMLIKERD